MNTRTLRAITTTVLRGCAYFSVILQWLWILLIALPPLIESGAFKTLRAPSSTDAPVVHLAPIEISPIAWVIIAGVTIVMLMLTVIVLVRLPRSVVNTGEKFVHQAAEAVMPALTHHKQLPAKKRRIISRRLMLAIQLILTILPAAICFLLPPVDELTRQIVLTIGLGLAAISFTTFVCAWIIEPAKVTLRTRSHASRG